MRVLYLPSRSESVADPLQRHLVQVGFELVIGSATGSDFVQDVALAQTLALSVCPQVVVGYDRGGAVAMNMKLETAPQLLLCPAWKKWGTATRVSGASVILHSPSDDVVPFADSLELVQHSGLSPEHLVPLGRDHQMADEATLTALEWYCRVLAEGVWNPDWGLGEMISNSNDSFAVAVPAEGAYLCDACGEEIVIPLDLAAGETQTYVEDCPVCCRANVIHVTIDSQGNSQVWAEPEQSN